MARTRQLVMIVNDDAAMRDAMQFALCLEGAEVRLHETGAGLLADPLLPACACVKPKLPPDDDTVKAPALPVVSLTIAS